MNNKSFLKDDDVDTPQALINATINKLSVMLAKHYPNHLAFGNGTFTIERGSTQVMIIVRPFNEVETCVECISNCVTGANINPELMNFLLRKNAELHFGSFGLLFDNTITFSSSITGSTLNSDVLITTLDTVAIIADYYDDIIVDMAGGKRAADLNNDFEELN